VRATRTISLILLLSFVARADFSFVVTRRVTAGNFADWFQGANEVTKCYWKGEKMMVDTPAKATIIDFEAQTVTTLNRTLKLWAVKKLNLPEKAALADVSLVLPEMRPTGQQKQITGFMASEAKGSIFVEGQWFESGPTMKMQVDREVWISADIPGISEMHTFFRKHASDFPWSELVTGTSPALRIERELLRRLVPNSQGVLIKETIRTRLPDFPQIGPMPEMNPVRAARTQETIANMVKASKWGAALLEVTTDVTEFSTASLPDSVFAAPEGYDHMAE
jgi:hypothetical protein